jgi:hypothetical protein
MAALYSEQAESRLNVVAMPLFCDIFGRDGSAPRIEGVTAEGLTRGFSLCNNQTNAGLIFEGEGLS